jgi:hypothetical protein
MSKKQTKVKPEIKTKQEEIVLIHSSKLVNHALKNNCQIVDNDSDSLIWIENKSNKDWKYYVRPNTIIRLEQAQFACWSSLKISLMSRKDWED